MALELRGISKNFGAVQALQDLSLRFEPGEIHGVIGENGAGKSTLMHICRGELTQTSGQIFLEGRPVSFSSPAQSQAAGIELVHQHFKLVPAFTVLENIALGLLRSLRHFPSRTEVEESLRPATEIGWTFDLDQKVAELSLATQQRLEIARCLCSRPKFLILDEPTAVLTPPEVESLFGVLRQLKRQGTGIVLIAHKLSEVLAIADKVSVLRHGKHIATCDRSETNAEQLMEWMVGEVVSSNEGKDREATGDLSPEPHPGEILGIGGVDGNGQEEFAERLAQLGSTDRLDIAYIPADRQREGLALDMTIGDNLRLGLLGRRDPRLWKPARTTNAWAQLLMDRFAINAQNPNRLARTLSGGNQQKVVLARALDQTPSLVVAVHPTRGLDFRATQFVHDQLRAAAQQGAAVLLISSDRDELAAVADRVLYLRRGELCGTLEESLA